MALSHQSFGMAPAEVVNHVRGACSYPGGYGNMGYRRYLENVPGEKHLPLYPRLSSRREYEKEEETVNDSLEA